METLKIYLRHLLETSKTKNVIFQRNLLKEYLQVIILDFLYSHPEYSELIFYGGSCLSHCFGLPRLSEDLDFIDINRKIDIYNLGRDVVDYFNKNTDLNISQKTQKFRVYLKFPILRELNLSDTNESELLFLKIEVFEEFDFCSKYQIQIIPLMKFNRSILIRTFDLPTLMSTKIMAIMHRKWEKTGKDGKTIMKVKGRDCFDLIWYLNKGILPNINCIKGIKDRDDLKKKLLSIVKNIDIKSVKMDIEQFMDNEKFVKNLSQNLRDILLREISIKL